MDFRSPSYAARLARIRGKSAPRARTPDSPSEPPPYREAVRHTRHARTLGWGRLARRTSTRHGHVRVTTKGADRRVQTAFAIPRIYAGRTYRPVARPTRPARTIPERPAMRRGTLGRLVDLAA